MHELGVVFHIVNGIEDVAKQNAVNKVVKTTLEIGEVSTVVIDYFRDCWNWAINKSDILRGSELEIETIPAVTFCENCKKTYPTVRYGKICPHCGSDKTYLKQGNEVNIKQIVVPDSAD